MLTLRNWTRSRATSLKRCVDDRDDNVDDDDKFLIKDFPNSKVSHPLWCVLVYNESIKTSSHIR
jgi:hypothetical protein